MTDTIEPTREVKPRTCADCPPKRNVITTLQTYHINGKDYCGYHGKKRWHEEHARLDREADQQYLFIFGRAPPKPKCDHEMERIRKMPDEKAKFTALLQRIQRKKGRCPSGDHAVDDCETHVECSEAREVIEAMAAGRQIRLRPDYGEL